MPRSLPFRNETFALTVLGLVAEHLDDAALAVTLAEVARVLEPGGRCLLSALHPDRTAAGQRARFIDPETGLRRPIRTYHRTIDSYHSAAAAAGMTLAEEQVLTVPPEPGRQASPGPALRRAGARVGGLLEEVDVGPWRALAESASAPSVPR